MDKVVNIFFTSYDDALIEAINNTKFLIEFDNLYNAYMSTHPAEFIIGVLRGKIATPKKLKYHFDCFIDFFINMYYVPLLSIELDKGLKQNNLI